MLAEVRSWPATIGGFEELRLGPAINSPVTGDYQYLLYMTVADEEALVRYQHHLVHRTF